MVGMRPISSSGFTAKVERRLARTAHVLLRDATAVAETRCRKVPDERGRPTTGDHSRGRSEKSDREVACGASSPHAAVHQICHCAYADLPWSTMALIRCFGTTISCPTFVQLRAEFLFSYVRNKHISCPLTTSHVTSLAFHCHASNWWVPNRRLRHAAST